MKKRNSATGFTLIELLVVIAIIAILAAILFPVFISAKESGLQTRCLANMKQVGTAVSSYLSDSNGCYPASLDGGSNGYRESLKRYTSGKSIWACPIKGTVDGAGGELMVSRYYCANMWGISGDQKLPKPYGSPLGLPKDPDWSVAPWNLSSPAERGAYNQAWSTYYRPCRDSETGGNTILIMCTKYGYPQGRISRWYPDPKTGWPRDRKTFPKSPEEYASHKGGFEVIFADGHARWIKAEQVRYGMWTAQRSD